MIRFSLSIKMLAVGATVMLMAGGVPATALAKTYKIDCTKNGKLQSTINSAVDGDVIEITGICQENIVIRDKRLTLAGASTPGPHGITGTAALTDAVLIENSLGTDIEGLTISNPLSTGVRMLRSDVTMTNCEVSGSGASITGGATGIGVEEFSNFTGTRVRLDGNRIGLRANQSSRALCQACDLNGNTIWAAVSRLNSVVSLLDSEVTGNQGIWSNGHSYIDIDCLSYVSDPDHTCSLNSTSIAGQAWADSTVAFYESGEFWGRFFAVDRSVVQLLGARQQTALTNSIDDNSSLTVAPGDTGASRLIGTTNVSGFSNALIYDVSTELNGSLNCNAGGDAWVDPAVDLLDPGFSINGCEHAP